MTFLKGGRMLTPPMEFLNSDILNFILIFIFISISSCKCAPNLIKSPLLPNVDRAVYGTFVLCHIDLCCQWRPGAPRLI